MAPRKAYDRAYYDRWYRNPRTKIATAAGLRRKVHLAVSAAEFMLARPIESVLDVGCGEGSWRAPLLRLRPGIEYQGIEASDYVVSRFGRRRNIRLGTFA